ncbi:hypothetical protein BC831DRAFT_468763, partial [Entophlyctis helioformis]
QSALPSPKDYVRFDLGLGSLQHKQHKQQPTQDNAVVGAAAQTAAVSRSQPHLDAVPATAGAAAGSVAGAGRPDSQATPAPPTDSHDDEDNDDDDDHYSMGLKHREKLIDDLKKENFGLKMRVYFLTENLQKMSPEGVADIVNEHAELKAIVEDMRLESRLRDELEGDIASKIVPAQETIERLEQRIRELEGQVLGKTAEADNIAMELQEAHRVMMAAEEGHAAALQLWEQRTMGLEQKLEEVLEAKQAHRDACTSPVKDIIMETPASTEDSPEVVKDLKKQIEYYKKRLEINDANSKESAQIMAKLEREIHRQTEELRIAHERLRTDNERRRSASNSPNNGSPRTAHAGKQPMESTAQVSKSSKEKRQSRQTAQHASMLMPTIHSTNSSQSMTDSEFRQFVDWMHQMRQVAQRAGLETALLTQFINQLLGVAAEPNTRDENHRRYVEGLKKRNKLLIRANNVLGHILEDEELKRMPIGDFNELEIAIQTKLEKLVTYSEIHQAILTEKKLWETKMSVLESKLSRALQPDRRAASAGIPGRPGSGASGPVATGAQGRASSPERTIITIPDGPLPKSDYEKLHAMIKDYQGRLEVERQNHQADNQGAQQRVQELLDAKNQLEKDFLLCSKQLTMADERHQKCLRIIQQKDAQLQHLLAHGGQTHAQEHANGQGGSDPAAKKRFAVPGSPDRIKQQLLKQADRPRQDGTVTTEEYRKLQMECSKLMASEKRLRQQRNENERMIEEARRTLNVLNERRHITDVSVVRQIAEQARQHLQGSSSAATSDPNVHASSVGTAAGGMTALDYGPTRHPVIVTGYQEPQRQQQQQQLPPQMLFSEKDPHVQMQHVVPLRRQQPPPPPPQAIQARRMPS